MSIDLSVYLNNCLVERRTFSFTLITTMRSTSTKVFFLLLINFLYNGNLVSSFLTPCSSTIPAIAPDPVSLEKIVKFIEAEMNGVKLFDEFVDSELNITEQAFTKYQYNLEDKYLSMKELVKKYGFEIEKYKVTTEDGYILTIFRIPGEGPPVLFNHGTCGSSEDFVSPGPDDSIAYATARAGFDVYFINVRGNKFSDKHITLSTACAEYWDFSFHEIGKYDLPATIDFILDLTKKEKLSIVGWSQGCTTFFVMGSIRPEYNDKVNIMIALSPVTYLYNCPSPIGRLLAFNTDLSYVFLSGIGYNNILPNNILTKALVGATCAPNPISEIACSSVLIMAFGFDGGHINATNLPIEMGHYPAGCSTKTVIHYFQSINVDKFRPFNYGTEKNNKVYGSDEPEEYPLEQVTAPVALVYGSRDWMVTPKDVAKLKSRLPNIVEDYTPENYNHIDYVWAKDVNVYIRGKMLSLLDKYNG